eukprot:CAMPEP_0115412718 /NCGR_PEP_ID=MMETSP0271-20121206/21700_1 /TAXON_ID=71861 /ORGANISM="Scrippsiella trochoidea, Strain CCMP3099" /LENGTH=69 /DNA_ID=CAMNT_0002836977 /DNA_START=69 /DNA_END=275 /DNA_ORIENTATION=-
MKAALLSTIFKACRMRTSSKLKPILLNFETGPDCDIAAPTATAKTTPNKSNSGLPHQVWLTPSADIKLT